MLTLVLLSSTPTLLSSISMLCNKNLPVAPKMPPTRELSCGRGLLKDGSRIATPIIEGSSSQPNVVLIKKLRRLFFRSLNENKKKKNFFLNEGREEILDSIQLTSPLNSCRISSYLPLKLNIAAQSTSKA